MKEETGEKETILIVDDDESTCRSLALILLKNGYEVETAGLGLEALEKAQGSLFNAALLDIRMPDIGGVDLIAPLKRIHPDIVIIMVTGRASLETAVMAQKKGASGYITKPFNVDEVLARIRDTLEKQRLVLENRKLLTKLRQELTERKRAEDALRDSETELPAILDNTPLVMMLVDREGSVRKLNQAAVQFTQRPAEEMLGLHGGDVLRCLHSFDDPRGCGFGPHCQTCVQRLTVMDTFQTGNGHHQVEVMHPYLRGGKEEEITFLVSTSLLNFSKGEMVLVCFEDITERKQNEEEKGKLLLAYKEQNQIIAISNLELEKALAKTKRVERELRSSERRFRKLFDESTDAVFIHDFKGRIFDVNRSACYMLGYPKDKLLEKLIPDLFPKEELPAFKKASKTIKEKGIVRFESKFERADETIIHIDISCRVIDIERRIVQGIARDITERKKMEEQLQHSQVLASLGTMTAGIAHEVNNPLGSILLYSELLLNDDLPRQTKKDLRVIHNESKRAAKIMTDLLAYSNGLKFQIRRLNLGKILRKVLTMRRYEQRVQNINVTTNLDGPLYVKGDYSQLTQVFMNLILNAEEALKESNGSNIIITTQIDGEWLKVSIADDGSGIPEENLSQVFHPFFTTKKVGEGTGLGLSTCYGIITAHGGLIRAENNEIGGATFTVDLPLNKLNPSTQIPKTSPITELLR